MVGWISDIIKLLVMKNYKILLLTLMVTLVGLAGCLEYDMQGEFEADETMMPEARTDAPENPATFFASYDDYCDRVVLSWVPTVRASAYNLYKSGEILAADLTDTSYVDMEAIAADTEYWVVSKNANGESEDSTFAIGRMADIPPAPENFNATDGEYESKVDLSWDPADYAKYYIVKRGDVVLDDSVVGTTYSDNIDAPEVETEYSLTAVSNCGESVAVTNTGYCDPLVAFKVALDENFEGFTAGVLATVEDYGGFVPRFQFENAPNNKGTVEIKTDNSKYIDLVVLNDNSSIQLYFPGITLIAGESYRISFDIKSPVLVSLHMGTDLTGEGLLGKVADNYLLPTLENTKNGNAYAVELEGTGEWKSYSFDFPQTGTGVRGDVDLATVDWVLGTIQEDEVNPLIAFQMWSKNQTFAVDNIKIELIQN